MATDDKDNDRTRSFTVLAAGTIVSHYKILSKIGAGGMGEVYLAQDTELERKVALKFLPPYLCLDEGCRKRFKREAQAAAKLDHSNIVTVHEVTEYEARPYIVMQYIEGQSLKEYLEADELSIEQILELSIQICEGLRTAHKAGIVHRDVKPSNILIDLEKRARIVDFGLASSRGSEKITMTGSTLGTVGYMSPEQARGEPTDHRSDLFSLGVVIYEMIAGRRPFRGEDEASTLVALTLDTPEPINLFRQDVPVELQKILTRLLEKNPDSRYQSADELSADLAVLRQEVVSGVTRVPKRTRSKGPMVFYASVGVLLALAAFVVVFGYVLHNEWLSFLPGTMTPEERVLASIQTGPETCLIVVAPFWGQTDEAIDEGKVMQALIQREISEELAGEEQVEILDEDISDIPRSHEQAKALAEKHDAAMVLWGEVLVLHGEVEIQPYVTMTRSGRSSLRSASVLEANLLEPNQLELRRSKAVEIGDMAILVAAQYHHRRGDLEKAMAVIEKTKRPTWESLTMQGTIAREQGKDDEFGRLYRQAFEVDSGSVRAHLRLAFAFRQIRQWDSALTTYQAALVLAPEDESIPIAISQAYSALGQREQAVSYLEDAVEANPASSALNGALGWAYWYARQVDDAMVAHRRAIELDPENGDAYYGLGWVYEFSFDDSLTPAAFCYNEAIRAGTRRFGRFSPHLTLGRVYTRQERYEDAVSEHLKAVSISPWYMGTYKYLWSNYARLDWGERGLTLFKGLVSLNPTNAELRSELRWLYVALDMTNEALAETKEVVRLTPEDGDAYADLGNLYDDVDSLEQAAQCYHEALRYGTKRWAAFTIHHRLAWNYIAQRKFDEAIEQERETLNLNPQAGYTRGAHWIIAHAYNCQGMHDDAASEYREAIAADSADVYAHFYYFLALARSGAPVQAREYMQGVSETFSDSSWSGWIFRFLNGDIDKEAFLKEARREEPKLPSENKLCEAYYYFGMNCLLGSMHRLEPEHPDTAKARDYFNKCLATDQKRFYEYLFARSELARLDGAI